MEYTILKDGKTYERNKQDIIDFVETEYAKLPEEDRNEIANDLIIELTLWFDKNQLLNDYKPRLEEIADLRLALNLANINEPNLALIRNEILSGNEELIQKLEAVNSSVKDEVDYEQIIQNRKREYPKLEELIVALWEGDQSVIDSLEAARQVVKAKYPKPE